MRFPPYLDLEPSHRRLPPVPGAEPPLQGTPLIQAHMEAQAQEELRVKRSFHKKSFSDDHRQGFNIFQSVQVPTDFLQALIDNSSKPLSQMCARNQVFI